MEEAGIPLKASLIPLDAVASVPAFHFPDRDLWGPNVYVVLERAFGIHLNGDLTIVLSREHTEYQWVAYEQASQLLKWDSNRTALWELNERLGRDDIIVSA